jgi:Protein of unknown function (DUF3035)
MPNKNPSRHLLHCMAVAALLLSVSGCESIRNFVAGKEPPDEFAVVTKAPLIIPPDYNLKPPKPGIAPLNQVSPTQSAEAALYSGDPKAVASTIGGTYSEAEKMLLAQTGAASASDSIRQQIAADNSNQQSADDSFTDQLLFGSSTGTGDAPLDADAEKARLDAAKARTPAPPAAAPVAAQPTPPTPQARVQPAPAAKPSGG